MSPDQTWPVAYDPEQSVNANRLSAGFRMGNREIAAKIASSSELRGMATTAVAVLIEGGTGTLAHVGDSRVYRLRDGQLDRLTRDHSWVEQQIRVGALSETAARQHPWLFRAQVSNSAFLLGYSFFEAFLADVIRQVYSARPRTLPKDKELKYREILDANDYASLLTTMIDREVRAALYGSIETVQSYVENKLGLEWPHFDRLVEASRLRNCLMHNMGRADARLAELSGWQVGQQIELAPDAVHQFGFDARDFAERLHSEAQKRLGTVDASEQGEQPGTS